MKKKLEGIGGWLIPPLIGLIIGSLWTLLLFFDTILNQVLIDFILYGIISIAYIWILSLMLRKKKAFPKIAIWFLWILAILSILSEFLLSSYHTVEQIGYAFGSNLGSIIWAIIWTLYFKKSIRVKNTFIN